MTKKKEYREFNNVTVVVYDVSEDHKNFSSWKLLPDKSPTMHGKDLIETQALTDEKARSKKLLEALKRCSTVCEGANEDILKGLLVTSCKIVEEIADKAIAQHEEGE